MALTKNQRKEAIKKLKELGLDENTIKQLTDDELENFFGQSQKKVVEITIEIDDSHRLPPEVFRKIVEDGLETVKGEQTLKEFVLLAIAGGKAYLRYQSGGLA